MNVFEEGKLLKIKLNENVSVCMDFCIPYDQLIAYLNTNDCCKDYLKMIASVKSNAYNFDIHTYGFSGFTDSLYDSGKKWREYYHMYHFNAEIRLGKLSNDQDSTDNFIACIKNEFTKYFNDVDFNYPNIFEWSFHEEDHILYFKTIEVPNEAVRSFSTILGAIWMTKFCLEKAATVWGLESGDFKLNFEMHKMF